MISKFDIIPLRRYENGLVLQSSVDDYFAPEGSVTKAINVNFDRIGTVKLRNGITLINAQITNNKSCLGLYYFNSSTASYCQKLAVFNDATDANSDIYYDNSGTWTKTRENLTQAVKVRFATFLNKVIAVNGSEVASAWAGTGAWSQYVGTAFGDLNLDDMDNNKCKFIEVFKSKIYMAGNSTYPNRLFESSIPTSTGYITWTPATGYTDFLFDDGAEITGLKRFATELLVFKKDFLYRYRGISGTDPDPFIKVGTTSQESIVEAKDGIYFYHPTAIYRYNGSYPQEISRPIAAFIDAIPVSFQDDVCSWIEADGNQVCFSIGDVTVDSVAYTNVVLRFTISSKVWTIYSMSSEIRFAHRYSDGTNYLAMVGDDDGNVLKWDNGLTDNGTAIEYEFITRWYEINKVSGQKILQELVVICESAQELKVQYQVDDENDWHIFKEQLVKFITPIENLNIKFHRIRFKIFGISSVAQWVFQGFEITKCLLEGQIYKK